MGVLNLNRRFPVAPGQDWADTTDTARIRIFLDDSDDITTILADTYRFSFPVMMPPTIPENNVWYVSLCDDRTCRQPGDRSVVVSFPMAGFDLYELAPEALRTSTNWAQLHARPSSVVGTLLA